MNKEELLNNKVFYKSFKNGEDQIQVSRDRQSSFEPALVPKRHNIIEGLEKIIIFFLNQRDESERYRETN